MYKKTTIGKNKTKRGGFLMLKKSMKTIVIIFIILSTIVGTYCIYKNQQVEALSKYGSSGDEVRQIQEKLKRWGYYNGNVDGIYGSQTTAAVKSFQRKNGLTVDGIAGSQTLTAMGITSSQSSSSGSSSSRPSDVNLIARAIYGEARGESYVGQVAVGAVIMNRVKSSKFPNTIAGVVYQKGAFDAVSDGQINLNPDNTAKKAAQDALNGWDPTYGAIYYFNPNTATNAWIWSRPMTVTIGKHRFCK